MPVRLSRFYYLRFKRILRNAARSAGTPEHIALGAAIGMVVAMTPTVGLQMALATAICLAFRANPLPAIPIVWLTNPLTIIPIYSFNYWIGTLLVPGSLHLSQFRDEFANVLRLYEECGVRKALAELAEMGWDIQMPLWLGCSVVGFVLAVPTYFIVLRSVVRIRRRIALRRAKKQAMRLGIRAEDVGSSPDDAAVAVQSDRFERELAIQEEQRGGGPHIQAGPEEGGDAGSGGRPSWE